MRNEYQQRRVPFAPLLMGGVFAGILAAAALAASGWPATIELAPAECATLSPIAPGTSTVFVVPSAGVTQPLGRAVRVAACSLSIANQTYTSAVLNLVHWDPQALAPDPTTIALRSRTFTPSSLSYGRSRADFSPPIVTAAISHVADAPQTPVALDWRVSDPSNGQSVRFEASAASALPVALQYPPNGSRAPIPGSHAGLNLSLCDGGAPYENLRLVQAVMRTDYLEPTTAAYEWVQRFRVPERTVLAWVEFALGLDPYHLSPGRLAIFDAEGQSAPPSSLGTSMVEAALNDLGWPQTSWSSHYDFDHTIVLQPDHDYWLAINGNHDYRLYFRTLDGSESADFTARIGPLFMRTANLAAWQAVPNRALDFRLIGAPSSVTDVALPATRRDAFALTVAPNPAKGAALVIWAGASGGVRIEVLDARGRRVATGDGTTGGEGRWTWSGLDARGGSLAAGVYFVRATDAAHRVAVRRVVRVR